jgi:hypothetical protein
LTPVLPNSAAAESSLTLRKEVKLPELVEQMQEQISEATRKMLNKLTERGSE